MKLKMVLLALFAAGAFAAMAIAKPPPKGSSSTETSPGKNPGKVLVCHKVGNGKWVLLSVSTKSAHARLKHGDVLAVNRTCPGPIQGHGGTTTSATTTTTP
jgi:hypothetical protein